MTTSKALAIITCALLLGGCQTIASNCAGWTKPPKVSNAANLVRKEPEISRWIIATDAFGKAQKCWR